VSRSCRAAPCPDGWALLRLNAARRPCAAKPPGGLRLAHEQGCRLALTTGACQPPYRRAVRAVPLAPPEPQGAVAPIDFTNALRTPEGQDALAALLDFDNCALPDDRRKALEKKVGRAARSMGPAAACMGAAPHACMGDSHARRLAASCARLRRPDPGGVACSVGSTAASVVGAPRSAGARLRCSGLPPFTPPPTLQRAGGAGGLPKGLPKGGV
jgi:hypothetical protein